ncbi:MAG: chemotaxis protein CheX [Magnetococcales bacterium]|nr:chemotaxis protein CheX [Magnetococcales bacterium]
MPERFIVSLREAIQEICETMLFVEVIPGESALTQSPLTGDYSAVIGYSGNLKGSMRLAGPEEAVLKLAGALLGEERGNFDLEMNDAYSEVANMVAGGVQTRVEDWLGPIRMSPPVVVTGRDHRVASDRSFLCVSHLFEISGIPFFTEIYYAQESLDNAEIRRNNPDAAPRLDDEDDTAVTINLNDGRDVGASGGSVSVSALTDSGKLHKAVRSAIEPELQSVMEATARDHVQEVLPEIAEKLVREEIERIKKEGL